MGLLLGYGWLEWWELQWLLGGQSAEWSLFGFLVTAVVLVLSIALLLAVLLDVLCSQEELTRSGVQLFEQKKELREIRRLILPQSAAKEAQELPDPVLHEPDSPGLASVHLWRRGVRNVQFALAFRKSRISHEQRWEHFRVDTKKLKNRRPVLVFVNSRSGGKQGEKVLCEVRAYLHEAQVVDLQREGPEAALEWWSKTELTYRILVCGGDGTVGWVLGVLEKMSLKYVPPVAILPLGTGNDLARVTGWGGGYTGESVLQCLRQVDEAHVSLLDRWAVFCRDAAMPSQIGQPSRPGLLSNALPRPAFLPALERKSFVMCNYLGVGVDAAVALEFHQMRERSPHLFFSRVVNKLWYLTSGTKTLMQNCCTNIGSKVKLECDGVEVDIPDNLEGVIVLNIPSFSGGTNLWGEDILGDPDSEEDSKEDSDENSDDVELEKALTATSSYAPADAGGASQPPKEVWAKATKGKDVLESLRQSMQDKKLEVVGVHGILQLGAAQVGLYSATRLAQASRVKITNRVDLPVEVDGEPRWFPRDGELEITFKSQAFMLAREHESKHFVATDVVDWALQRKIISNSQRDELMKEIARRSSQAMKRPSTSSSVAKLAFS